MYLYNSCAEIQIFNLRHEWEQEVAGVKTVLYLSKVDLSLFGNPIDGLETQTRAQDVYTEFYMRYQLIAGNLFGRKDQLGGMSIHDFEDNR